MATPLIPFTLAWLIGIWLASRIALPTLALSLATSVAIAGIILTWRAVSCARNWCTRTELSGSPPCTARVA